MDKTRASIAILSDRALCRSGLAALLRSQGFERISEYATSRELISGSHSHSPDVLLVDLDHEHEDTMTVLHSLRREFCGAFIVVIGTPSQQGAADGSYDAQVQTPDGDISVLIAAARLNGPARRTSRESRRQHALWDHVTPRQRDVLRWLATGADNSSIGSRLKISVRAVKSHVSTLLELFGVGNRTQLALLADRAGLRPPKHATG